MRLRNIFFKNVELSTDIQHGINNFFVHNNN